MNKVILIFVDGLGIGANDPQNNPCAQEGIRLLSNFKDQPSQAVQSSSGRLFSVDAILGVDGIPQSATGQATLLSGINCPEKIGRHLPGFPNEKIRAILKEHSLLKKLKENGLKPVFINAFRPLFFKLPMALKWRLSATTVATLAADLDFFQIGDITNRKSLYHEFTNQYLIHKGFHVPRFTHDDAADILYNALENNDFILYEYFLTDRAGHAQRMDRAHQEIFQIDCLINSLLQKINLEKTWLILTSDHGNIEDLSMKTHTRNPVMTIIWSKNSDLYKIKLNTLTDLKPLFLNLLKTK